MVRAGEGDGQLWRSTWCHCRVAWRPTLGEWADLVPLQGAIVVCYRGRREGWRPTLGVPLQGAIVVCYGLGGGWRPTLGEWTWCHCWPLRVPVRGAIVVCYGWGGRVTTNFGGVDVMPLQGAIVVCYGLGGGWRPTLGEWTVDVAGCHCRVPL